MCFLRSVKLRILQLFSKPQGKEVGAFCSNVMAPTPKTPSKMRLEIGFSIYIHGERKPKNWMICFDISGESASNFCLGIRVATASFWMWVYYSCQPHRIHVCFFCPRLVVFNRICLSSWNSWEPTWGIPSRTLPKTDMVCWKITSRFFNEKYTWIHRWWILHSIVTLVFFLGGWNRLMFDKFHDDVQSVCSPEKAPFQKWVKWSFSTPFTNWFSKKTAWWIWITVKGKIRGPRSQKISRIWRHHHMRHKNPKFEYPMPSNTPTNDVKISVEADVICLFFQNKHHSSHPKQFGKLFIQQNWISMIIQLEVGGTTLGREDSGTIHCFAYQLYVFKWTTSHWVQIDFNKRSTHQQNSQHQKLSNNLTVQRIINENPWKLSFMTPGSEQHVFFFRFSLHNCNGSKSSHHHQRPFTVTGSEMCGLHFQCRSFYIGNCWKVIWNLLEHPKMDGL